MANKLRIVFNFVTKDWAQLAPQLLGCLVHIVDDLPPGPSMAEHYNSSLSSPVANMPPLLAAFIHARSELVHAEAAAAESLNGLRFAVDARKFAHRGALAALGCDAVWRFEEYRHFLEADTICQEAHTAAFDAHVFRFKSLDRLAALWSGVPNDFHSFYSIHSLGESASEEIMGLYLRAHQLE